jgi:RNA polymerase sigma-70 factor (family 1)
MGEQSEHIERSAAADEVKLFLDQAEFERIYERAQPGLFWLSVRILENQQEAEDVVTESFLKLWHHRAGFSQEAAAVAWLRVTTRNACLNLLRQNEARSTRLREMTELMENVEYEMHHEDLLAALLEEVLEAIAALPEKSREVFQLRYLHGLRNEEISERLGIRYQSVRNHLTTALKTLRLKLGHKSHLLPVVLILLQRSD